MGYFLWGGRYRSEGLFRSFIKENATRFLLFHSLHRTRGRFASQNPRVQMSRLFRSKKIEVKKTSVFLGGEGEIRTRGTIAGTTVFKTVTFNHSVTSPYYQKGPAPSLYFWNKSRNQLFPRILLKSKIRSTNASWNSLYLSKIISVRPEVGGQQPRPRRLSRRRS